MKKLSINTALTVCLLGLSVHALAGNKDRIGQAGAQELMINPWGMSTGVFGLNTANVTGLDAMKTNVAGLAFVNKTEVGLAYTQYLTGSKVNVSNLGFAQKLGKNFGVLGVNVMSMGFGEITITDDNNPEGSVGTYSPQFFNIMLGFSKEFSNSIRAGIGATFISEQISNVKANGTCFEAGIQYVTGKRDNFHFGITLRNMGTNMRFTGSGFSINGEAPQSELYQMNRQTPTEKFEMPTYLNFGAAYDFYLDENKVHPDEVQGSDEFKPKHRATIMANFTSNSFNSDYLGIALEYSFKEMFMIRGGYRYENKITSYEESTTFYTGFSAGASVVQQIGDNGPKLALDYSYRPTSRPANGVHTISLRFVR